MRGGEREKGMRNTCSWGGKKGFSWLLERVPAPALPRNADPSQAFPIPHCHVEHPLSTPQEVMAETLLPNTRSPDAVVCLGLSLRQHPPLSLFIFFFQPALTGARAWGKSEEFLDFSECCELLLFSDTYFLPYLK